MIKIEVRGLDEFRRELKAMDRRWGTELRKSFVVIAAMVAAAASSAAPGRASGVIRGRGTQRGAFVDIGVSRGDEIAVFFGQNRKSGWYGRPRYSGSTGRQHEPWVGNQWVPGSGSGQPYHIGAAINASVEPAIETLGDGIEKLASRAFNR